MSAYRTPSAPPPPWTRRQRRDVLRPLAAVLVCALASEACVRAVKWYALRPPEPPAPCVDEWKNADQHIRATCQPGARLVLLADGNILCQCAPAKDGSP